MELTGKVALVTGGGRGIGRETALALAAAGADVAVLARSESELNEAAGAIRALGRRALALVCDLSEPGLALDRVAAELGPVQVLVNNAGVAPSCKLQETSDELWARTIAVNLTGAFGFSRAALPAMLAAGWGRIISIASTAAKAGYPYNAAYVASKHGLLGLTRALAVEVARMGVTVNAVCPGFVDTDIVRDAVANLVQRTGRSGAEARRAFEKMSPQQRLITPAEVAACVVYLAGEGARGINGQGIVIDGGGIQS